MHSASSLQLNKDCWHRGRRLQTYLSNRDLIHACTESHCDIYNSLPLSPPTLSVSLPCWLHSLCNHVLSPSDEKLITLHSYQREPSPHCWHRLDCCVCTLLLRTRTWIDKTAWCFLSWGYEQDYYLDNRGGVSCCLIIYFNIIKQICLSDSTDEGK